MGVLGSISNRTQNGPDGVPKSKWPYRERIGVPGSFVRDAIFLAAIAKALVCVPSLLTVLHSKIVDHVHKLRIGHLTDAAKIPCM